MTCAAGDVIALMEEIAPPGWAEDWDNCGLQAGSPRAEVDAVLLALDVTDEVVAEARERGAGLLVCHHPLIFKPLRRLPGDEPAGSLLREVMITGLVVYAAHSNLDASPHGVNVALAELLGLRDHQPLLRPRAGGAFKLVTFLPPQHVAAVSAALFRAGAGNIADYGGCSFRVEGTGTFTPGPGAHPAYGEAAGENEVREARLEVTVPADRLQEAVAAVLSSHPYEEPAYDMYPLHVTAGSGLGRVGDLPAPVSLEELAHTCRLELGNAALQVAGEAGMEIRRVAVCGGSGGKLAGEALAAGAQVLVTGDVSHHQALDAVAAGLAVIDAGHYHTERPVLPHLASELARMADERGLAVEFSVSEIRTCPWMDGGAW